MNAAKPAEYKMEDFYPVDAAVLRIDVNLPFDCFLYLEKNKKFIHWIRMNTVFTNDHFEKLGKFGQPKVLVLKTQLKEFENYRNAGDTGPTAVTGEVGETSENVAVTGDVDDGKPADLIHVKGFKVKSEVRRVFGSLHLRSGIEIIKGQVQPAQGPIHIKGQAPAAAPAQTTQLKAKVDAGFLNTVIQATQKTFLDVCAMQIRYHAPMRRRQDSESAFEIEVAAFVGLVSQSIRGTVGICFPAQTYLQTLTQATGQMVTELSPEIYCGAGELMQMIFELARPKLAEQGYVLDRAVPLFVAGKNMSLPHLMPDPGFSIGFDSPGGPFQFEIGIKTGA